MGANPIDGNFSWYHLCSFMKKIYLYICCIKIEVNRRLYLSVLSCIERLLLFVCAYDIAGKWDNLSVIVTVKTKTITTTKKCCLHITNWASVQSSSGERRKKKRQVARSRALTRLFIRRFFAPTRKRWLHSEINWAINLLAVITYLFGVFYKYTTKDRLTRQFERIGFCCRTFFFRMENCFLNGYWGKNSTQR